MKIPHRNFIIKHQNYLISVTSHHHHYHHHHHHYHKKITKFSIINNNSVMHTSPSSLSSASPIVSSSQQQQSPSTRLWNHEHGHDDDADQRKKSQYVSSIALYLNLILQHIDKQHLIAFSSLVTALTLYVLLVPLTQPRIIRFGENDNIQAVTTTSNNNNNNKEDTHQNHQHHHPHIFVSSTNHEQWKSAIETLDVTLNHIFTEVMPQTLKRVDNIKMEREASMQKESSSVEDESSVVGSSKKTKITAAAASLKKFTILLENEISQVQREKEDAIRNVINQNNINNKFGGQNPVGQNYWQQQQRYQATVPESACDQILNHDNDQELQQAKFTHIGMGVGNNNPNQRQGGASAFNRGRINAQMIENESPQEPVSERPSGPYSPPPDPQTAQMTNREKLVHQLEFVKSAMVHSWRAYHDRAWGMDEYQPRTCSGKNWNEEQPYISLALSMIDGLTTLHIMGLHTEVDEALEYIRKMSFAKQTTISTFETTIRVVGSLLSIYELRGEKEDWILRKAQDVADRLMFAFNTTSGLPHNTVDLYSHRHFSPDWAAGASVLSEFGTVQLELRTLSYHTKDPSYDIRATHIMDIVQVKAPRDFMCPVYMSISTANWLTDHISLGALGDSFYEYIVKQYLLTGKTETRYQKMFRKIGDAIVDKLVFRSAISDWAYTAEWRRNEFYHKQDHLACFIGGSLALAANKLLDPENLPEDVKRKEKWMKTAGDLTSTCYEMYHQQRSGVSPENVEFMSAGADFINGPGYYILRPETMESLFYLWRFTKNQKFRDYGWNIFRAIDRWCKVSSGGYSGLKDVNVRRPIKDNLQQSFWLAETLKYSYLLFTDDSVIDLDEWVFNTEAHPLKIRKRDPLDIWREYEENNPEKKVNWDPPIVAGVSDIVRTETENMKKRRLQGHYRPSAKDQFSEEMDGVAGGVPDDEGMPFDQNRAMRGIPKISRHNRGAWFGVQSAKVLFQGAPVAGANNYRSAEQQRLYGNNPYAYENGYGGQKQPAPPLPPLPGHNANQDNIYHPNSPPINSNNNNNQNVARKSSFASRYKGAYQKAGGKK